MYNALKPNPDELPSAARLFKSTVFAAIAALVILITIVLPAEYGFDPTGIGHFLGLTEMGHAKSHQDHDHGHDDHKHDDHKHDDDKHDHGDNKHSHGDHNHNHDK